MYTSVRKYGKHFVINLLTRKVHSTWDSETEASDLVRDFNKRFKKLIENGKKLTKLKFTKKGSKTDI